MPLGRFGRMEKSFWYQKKVLITGHTGFKGTWLTLWLTSLGADVIGYSLNPPSTPHLFGIAEVSQECCSIKGDITDYPLLLQTLTEHQPEIIFHLAAQPLVQQSYTAPLTTYHTNVLGTVHVLEAARQTKSVHVIINVTSDKCYKNDGLGNHSFQETDPLGGHDPYSASKACAEVVTESYQKSFFQTALSSAPRLASVRAGNVIGGGDWAADRLFPDIARALIHSSKLSIRNPNAIRPWQHVLDPLHGYLLLAEKLWNNPTYAQSWNFGPIDHSYLTVREMVDQAAIIWNENIEIAKPSTTPPYESPILTLDSSKAIHSLGWYPKLTTTKAITWTVQWYQQYQAGKDIKSFTRQQINRFINL
ncbi:CDP-glucose 4,6-dehydratase [Brevibacillus laterosporus]|nr:CDP-glucose 4,6-dehydratase [Brevibacillus laterosporus]